MYAAVLACPDLCGRGQTVLLQVNLCDWKSSFHNFGYAALKDLSLTPEKDLPLKNTLLHLRVLLLPFIVLLQNTHTTLAENVENLISAQPRISAHLE